LLVWRRLYAAGEFGRFATLQWPFSIQSFSSARALSWNAGELIELGFEGVADFAVGLLLNVCGILSSR
jgi:hypothetical protein